MKPESNAIKKIDFEINRFKYYVKIDRDLTETEKKQLIEILASFPHSNDKRTKWFEKFLLLKFENYSKELLKIAANAYDEPGNTMLGIACEYGEVDKVQRLIDLGANLDLPDDKMQKLPLHWAIGNRLSYSDRNAYSAAEVVKCLLRNNTRIDTTSYENCTPLKYAEDREYTAAAKLIRDDCACKVKKKVTIGLFEGMLSDDVSGYLSQFLTIKDAGIIARVRKAAWLNWKEKSNLFCETTRFPAEEHKVKKLKNG